MKTGCCLLLLATPDDPLARRAVPLAGQSGYDYAEVSLARLLLLDARETAAYRKLLDEARLPAEVFNNAIPKGMALIGPHADPVRLEDYIHRSLLVAEQMGTGLITMSGPNRATVPEGFDWERDGDHLPDRVAANLYLNDKLTAELTLLPVEGGAWIDD